MNLEDWKRLSSDERRQLVARWNPYAGDGEPIDLAFRALQGRDAALRGTALEYLDHVLPAPIRAALWPMLGADSGASVAARRSVDEVREELSRSSWRLSVEGRARGSAAG